MTEVGTLRKANVRRVVPTWFLKITIRGRGQATSTRKIVARAAAGAQFPAAGRKNTTIATTELRTTRIIALLTKTGKARSTIVRGPGITTETTVIPHQVVVPLPPRTPRLHAARIAAVQAPARMEGPEEEIKELKQITC